MKLSILIVGPQGTGKTTLADSIVADYDQRRIIDVIYRGTSSLDPLLINSILDFQLKEKENDCLRIHFESAKMTQRDFEVLQELARSKEVKIRKDAGEKAIYRFSLILVELQTKAPINPADFSFFDQIIILNRLPQYAESQEEKSALPAQ